MSGDPMQRLALGTVGSWMVLASEDLSRPKELKVFVRIKSSNFKPSKSKSKSMLR